MRARSAARARAADRVHEIAPSEDAALPTSGAAIRHVTG